MQNLNIRLSVNPKCELVAIDDTDYNTLYDYESLIADLTNYICLEFIVDNIGEISKDTIKFYEYPVVQNEFLIKNTSVFPLKKDGTFTYYKYLIPKLAHLLKTEDVEYYQSANQVYYNDGKIYFAESDYEKIEDLQINSIQITDLKKLWDLQGTQMFSFHEVLFSICKLQKCLMFLQYKILNSTSNCIGKLSLKNDRLTRDFLLAAIYIFDYLKDHNNYDEAQRVLDDLLSCSGSLCPSEYDIKNTCDCGEIVQ